MFICIYIYIYITNLAGRICECLGLQGGAGCFPCRWVAPVTAAWRVQYSSWTTTPCHHMVAVTNQAQYCHCFGQGRSTLLCSGGGGGGGGGGQTAAFAYRPLRPWSASYLRSFACYPTLDPFCCLGAEGRARLGHNKR